MDRAGLAGRLSSLIDRRGQRWNDCATRLDGPILIAPTRAGRRARVLLRDLSREVFTELGIAEEMVQDNHSRSRKGIVRGMHFQIGAGAAKLVRCARGAIYDVMVDLRAGSPTFGQWEGFELTEENMRIGVLPDRLRARLLRRSATWPT